MKNFQNNQFDRESISAERANAFTCVNDWQASRVSDQWPSLDRLHAQENRPETPSSTRSPATHSKFRTLIMKRAHDLEALKVTKKNSNKRKCADTPSKDLRDANEIVAKPLKEVASKSACKHKSITATTESMETPKSDFAANGVSLKAMTTLDGFRFSANHQEVYRKELTWAADEAEKASTEGSKEGNRKLSQPGCVWDDYSGRLVELYSNGTTRCLIEPADVHSSELSLNASHLSTGKAGKDFSPFHYKCRNEDSQRYLVQSPVEVQSRDIQPSMEELEAVVDYLGDYDEDFGNPPFTQFKFKDDPSHLVSTEGQMQLPGKQQRTTTADEDFPERVANIDLIQFSDSDRLDSADFYHSSFDTSTLDPGTTTNATHSIEVVQTKDPKSEQLILENRTSWKQQSTSERIKLTGVNGERDDLLVAASRITRPNRPCSTLASVDVPTCSKFRKNQFPKAPFPAFLRKETPLLVTSTSTIPGLRPEGHITTCFRIAEALRCTSSASSPSLVELYALVTSSIRSGDGASQSFVFADIFFPHHPPYLCGVYAKCSESRLFDDDSRVFLKSGPGNKAVLARAIIRLKIDLVESVQPEQNMGFLRTQKYRSREMEILSIYECPWEDIEYTRGIVSPVEERQIREAGREIFVKPGNDMQAQQSGN